MTAFALLAAGSCPRHEELALGLCAELGRAEDDARDRLRELAAGLGPAGDPAAEIEAVRALVATLAPSPRGTLLLPDALGGGGHPAVVAVAAAAAAGHAGFGVEPVGDNRGRLYLAHAALEPPLVIDPSAPARLIDGRFLGTDLSWRCAHETALCLLDHIVTRATRPGDLATALAASALRLALPLDERGRRTVAEDHARLLARMN
jgi:hypothetical protein